MRIFMMRLKYIQNTSVVMHKECKLGEMTQSESDTTLEK